MAIEEIRQTPTRLTIYPESRQANNTVVSDSSATKSAVQNESQSGTDYSFWDFLDLINPLQHIPIVNTIYREATGDTIKPELKLAGGAVLGGPLGFVSSLADVIFEQETGKDIGSTMVAAVFGDETEAPVQVAKAQESIQHSAVRIQEMELPISSHRWSNTKNDDEDERHARLSQIDPMSKEVLALYGGSASPLQASQAYQQADMRGVLQQASLNQTF